QMFLMVLRSPVAGPALSARCTRASGAAAAAASPPAARPERRRKVRRSRVAPVVPASARASPVFGVLVALRFLVSIAGLPISLAPVALEPRQGVDSLDVLALAVAGRGLPRYRLRRRRRGD